MKRRLLYTYDIECTDWDQPICACAYCEDGRAWTFWGSDCLERLAELIREEGGDWCAHVGGRYDLPLLLQYAAQELGGLRELVITGSTILSAKVRGRRATLRDTYPLTLASLAKIGKWTGVPKGDDIDRGRLEEYSSTEVLEYCLQDCRALMAGVTQIRDFQLDQGLERMAWTSGSTAVKLLEAYERDAWLELVANRCRRDVAEEASGAVRGGRVECWARGVRHNVYSYDFKSSYPARYARPGHPVGLGAREAKAHELELVTNGKAALPGLYRCAWDWPWRDQIPPRTDEMTGAGFGYCEAWLCDDEVRAFWSVGVGVRALRGFVAKTELELGGVFAARLFQAKEDGTPWAKVFLNSLHGKFGERPLKEKWNEEHPDRWFGPRPISQRVGASRWWRYLDYERGALPPHVQPIAAGQILGRARVALWEVLDKLNRAGWPVLYCDTDSCHTTAPPPVVEELIGLGNELGELAIESGPCTGYYLGPKSYLLVGSDGQVVKSALKGVPLGALREGVLERRGDGRAMFRQARGKERGEDMREQLFREALASQLGADVQKEGVATFREGINLGGWKKLVQTRKVKPTGRGRSFDDGGGWRYLARQECADQTEALEDIFDPDQQEFWA